MNFAKRSYQKELLDEPGIPFADIKRNMQELEFINSFLGGHRITLNGFRRLLGARREIHVCEIGCGGGDNLKAVWRWCVQKGIRVRLTGIDINAECIQYAQENCNGIQDLQLVVSDYKQVSFAEEKPDIIFSSLFCHHLTNEELAGMTGWCQSNSGTGYFVNDLHRHPVAFYSIKWLTRLFSRSYLVKHDAPLSVLRGFRKEDLIHLTRPDLETSVSWQWAFRWLVISRHAS